ncbi:hypothetical protein [Pseudomonas sp. R37(2017)]|uniref:hypothetical protein n=1 Tax=Pseudomonas sp. R37(2017) TaxID=1981685 RepID=UPI000A1EBBE2|nr:hypothetical protein [Pseudomonas sp. R37(2017)]
MSTTTDEMAIVMIGDEVLRLLTLPDDQLHEQAFEGLRLIADLARWREMAYGKELLKPSSSCSVQ